LLSIIIAFLFLSCLAGCVMLIYFSKRPLKQEKIEEQGFIPESAIRHIDEVIDYDDIKDGIIYRNGRCFGLAQVEGINFSVMSPEEQNSRETSIVEIFNSMDYSIEFITTTTVPDMSNAAQSIAAFAGQMKDCPLKMYITCYAGILEQMKRERKVLAQQTYMVISSDSADSDSHPAKVIKERMRILESSFRERVGIFITPLETTEDILNAIQHIVLPDQIINASERIATGACAPVHFNVEEGANYVQAI
jgi:hypothetical protein